METSSQNLLSDYEAITDDLVMDSTSLLESVESMKISMQEEEGTSIIQKHCCNVTMHPFTYWSFDHVAPILLFYNHNEYNIIMLLS